MNVSSSILAQTQHSHFSSGGLLRQRFRFPTLPYIRCSHISWKHLLLMPITVET